MNDHNVNGDERGREEQIMVLKPTGGKIGHNPGTRQDTTRN